MHPPWPLVDTLPSFESRSIRLMHCNLCHLPDPRHSWYSIPLVVGYLFEIANMLLLPWLPHIFVPISLVLQNWNERKRGRELYSPKFEAEIYDYLLHVKVIVTIIFSQKFSFYLFISFRIFHFLNSSWMSLRNLKVTFVGIFV